MFYDLGFCKKTQSRSQLIQFSVPLYSYNSKEKTNVIYLNAMILETVQIFHTMPMIHKFYFVTWMATLTGHCILIYVT